jgi:hypothetical protein
MIKIIMSQATQLLWASLRRTLVRQNNSQLILEKKLIINFSIPARD